MKKKEFLFAAVLAAVILPQAHAKIRKVNNERIRYYESTRSHGMGVTYSTDFSFFDGFAANPALLPYMGKKKNISGLDAMIGSNMFSPIMNGIKDSFSDYIGFCKDIFEDGNVNFDFSLGTPFMGGFIKDGFGWQLASVAYASANIAGLNNTQTALGDETVIQIAYGRELFNRADRHRISFGIGIKTAFDTHMGIERLSDIPDNAQYDDLPQFFRFALGFDLGMTYRFSDWLCASAVWRDAATPYCRRNLSDGTSKTGIIRQNLVFGAGFFLPTEKMKISKVVPEWRAFIDLCDFTHWFSRFNRNPWLNIGIGTEMCLFKFMFLRAGIYELHWHVGLGFKAKIFRFDVAAFGRELGTEPDSRNQGCVSLSFRFCE